MTLLQLISQDPSVSRLLKEIESRRLHLTVGGVGEGFVPLLTALLFKKFSRPLLLLFAGEERMNQTLQLLEGMRFSPLRFPPNESFFGEKSASSADLRAERIRTLSALDGKDPPLILATIKSLLQPCSLPQFLHDHSLLLRRGETVDQERVLSFLRTAGFSRTHRVEQLGEFAVRGGIIDVFPPNLHSPLRLELMEDVLESLRSFDPQSQISAGECEEAVLFPWRLFFLPEARIGAIRENLKSTVEALRRKGKNSEARLLSEEVGTDLAFLGQGTWFLEEDYYLPFFSPAATLLNYLPKESLVLLEEGKWQESYQVVRHSSEGAYAASVERGEVLPYSNVEWLGPELKSQHFSLLPDEGSLLSWLESFSLLSVTPFSSSFQLEMETIPSFQGQIGEFKGYVHSWANAGGTVILTGRALDRQKEILKEEKIVAIDNLDFPLEKGRAYLWAVPLSPGFSLKSSLLFLSDWELFGWRRRMKPIRAYRQSRTIGTWEELRSGDYVVHENYGIGKYDGLVNLTIDNSSRDYVQISYAEEDKLYLPTEQIYLLQKYLGDEAKPPHLTWLHSQEWSQVKKRAKRSAELVAKELLNLYARREMMKLESFPKVPLWEENLALSFPYDETPDQDRAINEVIGDLEQGKLMDRLICGDVGYGKTEVAIRAAFRTILNGKQVALLAPTTILCQQHYNTFLERMREFPVKVDTLSRFRSPREQQAVIDGLRKGSVDIVIGTHRLLSQDLQFKDLGLLIIDEEQRFGVQHKERIKKLRGDVHVLTLTATPIPRTLQRSLFGILDVSLIETAPPNRFPVKTFVVETDDELIRNAILREMKRGGQVYFVHNRIRGLPYWQGKLEVLVPEAKIAVAHGKVPEEHLEQMIYHFAQGDFDVLLCTAIIESGIDISNVNTLIVSDAQNLGLAQLYQLRGRVGRGDLHAFAYFLYPEKKALSEEAERRLEAIRDFTHLGAGLKIAMRDLEIRGAGNLLGEEQHGFMTAVGFQMYRQLLEETIEQLRSGRPEKREGRKRTTVELALDAYIPAQYVEDEATKMELYERLSSMKRPQDLTSFRREVRDRFGRIPIPFQILMQGVNARILAENLKIERIFLQENLLIFFWGEKASFEPSALVSLATKFPRRLKVREKELYLRLERDEPERALDIAVEILHSLSPIET